MTAILKKELRQMKGTMPVYVFASFILAVTGLYFSYTNLNLASPQFEASLRNIRFVFVIFIPLFTMRSIAEERRSRTDQLLMTLSLTDTQIALGKFFSMLISFTIPMLVVGLYPLILHLYGQVNLRAAYLSILGFFLLGCTCIAIGEFASSLTENPVTAAVISFAMLLLCYLMDTISKMVPGTAAGSLTGFLVTAVLTGLLLWKLTKKLLPAAVCALVLGAIPTGVYLLKRPLLEGSFQKLLSVFYLNGRLTGLSEGLMDLPAVLYYVTVTVLFLFLTVQVLSLRLTDADERLYNIFMTALVITACILANKMALRLPEKISQPDFSDEKLYTLSDTTVTFLRDLDCEAALYLICENGKEDDTVEKLLQRYADESTCLMVRQVDPAVYPAFVSRYTPERVDNNSIIAVCGEKSRVVAAKDLYTWGISHATGRTIATGFDGEGLITSALSYVTSDEVPVMYVLNANGERSLEGSFAEAVKRYNIEMRPLNLLTETAVPDDADAIFIAAPGRDYSDEETEAVLSYLERGGNAILLTDFSMEETPGLDRILADYGLVREPGIILEGDSSRFISYQYCLIPDVNYSELTQKLYPDTYLLMPMAQGLNETETRRASVSFQPLLTTGTASYCKADVQNMTTAEKEEGDVEGPFTTGILAEEDTDRDQKADTRLAVFTSGYLLDEDYNRSVSGANAELIGEAAGALCRREDGAGTIPMKNLQPVSLAISDRAANTWAAVCTFFVPALTIAAGAAVWAYRRKRQK